jgi:Galactosyltransferase
MIITRPFLAIVSCHRYNKRIDAIRATWLKLIEGIDYKIFYGRGADRAPLPDEVFLDVDDSYDGLPLKTQAIMDWASRHKYDAVCKIDDDVYVFPERLIRCLPNGLYEGRINSHSQIASLGWCSGFSYWLAGWAIELVANAGTPTHKFEDCWVGSIMSKNGIKATTQPNFRAMHTIHKDQWSKHKGSIITACEFREEQMLEFDRAMRDPNWNYQQAQVRDTRTGKRVVRFGEVLRKTSHKRR